MSVSEFVSIPGKTGAMRITHNAVHKVVGYLLSLVSESAPAASMTQTIQRAASPSRHVGNAALGPGPNGEAADWELLGRRPALQPGRRAG